MKFYLYEKEGAKLSHAEGGGDRKGFGGSFNWRSLSHTEVGRKTFPSFKRGGAKCFTLSLGETYKVSYLLFSHFGHPPPCNQ